MRTKASELLLVCISESELGILPCKRASVTI